MLEVLATDVLSVEADALVVPIDGTIRPKNLEMLLGSVGRQFHRRYPQAELLDALESQLDLPLPLGQSASIEVEGGPFKILLVVSTLHHAQELAPSAKSALARTAFAGALEKAREAAAGIVATAVLQGGWRLTPQAAFGAMLQALPRGNEGVRVKVCCLDASLAESFRGQAQSLGLLVSPGQPPR